MPITLQSEGSQPSPPSRTGAAQAVLTRTPSTLYGTPLPERQAALRTAAGQRPYIRWTMLDAQGLPVDLTTLVVLDEANGQTGVPMRLLVAEASTAAAFLYSVDVTVLDLETGLVEARVDTAAFGGPGIFNAEFAALSSYGPTATPVFSNRFFLAVDRSLFAGRLATLGPPTMAEIRLHLRDSSPAENRLLGTLSFDDAEIAACVARCVDYFNEALPPLVQTYTTQTFPFRFMWLEGTVAGLYTLAAEWYRKNHLSYQAAGVAVDDLNKAPEYEALADKKWQRFEQMVRQRKIALNIDEGYGSLGSEYGWAGDIYGYSNYPSY